MDEARISVFHWILDTYASDPETGINLLRTTPLWPSLSNNVQNNIIGAMEYAHNTVKRNLDKYCYPLKKGTSMLDLLHDELVVNSIEFEEYQEYYGLTTNETYREAKQIVTVFKSWHIEYMARQNAPVRDARTQDTIEQLLDE